MRAGWTLADVGARLPWRALASLASHPLPGSSLMAALHPEEAPWLDGRKVAPLLADVLDDLRGLAYAYVRRNALHPSLVPKPEPVPRPWAGGRAGGRHFGSGALEPAALEAWLAARQSRPDEG